MDTIELLQKNLLFRGCSRDDFELLTGLFQERRVQSGMTIFAEKMPAEALYIIKTGQVRITILGADGDEVGLLQLGAGDFFGEIALLQESSRAVTARAETACEVVMLTRKDFQALIDLEPRIAAKITLSIARLLAMRVKAYSNKLRDILLS
ncbi:MAG: cyclic nucleotide-binding domain-containing protein [Nitrospiraceae bacterium]|nr:cyclic nucleotide-binding domain-containing protein [Nitrospiraceae bacterium]